MYLKQILPVILSRHSMNVERQHFAGLWGPSCELEVAVPVLMKLTEEN